MSHERIMMLNTMGVFNMVNAINYSQALDYFYQAMNLASESGDRGDYYRSLTNVTIIHYYRRDPEGLETPAPSTTTDARTAMPRASTPGR